MLATSPAGRSANGLAADLYGDPSKAVTVRAELSRLRKQFAGLIAAQPYRLASTVDLEVAYPIDMSMLLPLSTAPALGAMRANHQKC